MYFPADKNSTFGLVCGYETVHRPITLNAKHLFGLAIIVWLSGSLSGCGGRSSHPVAASNAFDDQLTCGHLTAERTVNQARIVDLAGEKTNGQSNNVGLLLTNPLMMDLGSPEQQEIDALNRRNLVLDGLIDRKCPKQS
jgi:hypothetical protein